MEIYGLDIPSPFTTASQTSSWIISKHITTLGLSIAAKLGHGGEMKIKTKMSTLTFSLTELSHFRGTLLFFLDLKVGFLR